MQSVTGRQAAQGLSKKRTAGDARTDKEPASALKGDTDSQKVLSSMTGDLVGSKEALIDEKSNESPDKVQHSGDLGGSKAEHITRSGHHELSTHGIGRDLDENVWRSLGRQLLQAGLVQQEGQYGGYSLTPSAWPVLKGEEKFEGRLPRPETKLTRSGRSGRSGRKAAKNTVLNAQELELFELLRAKRKALADKKGVPPYVVFSDRTLIEMCQNLPQDLTAFGAIHGVGQKKLSVYGDAFLAVLNEWQSP